MNAARIEWTEKSWNPVTGCTPVSEGCRNCYARRMAHRLRGRFGYPADEPFRVTLHPERLREPIGLRKPRRIFVVSMGDLFHDDVPESFIDQVFAVMALCSEHTFQVLTKRPARMLNYCSYSHRDSEIMARMDELIPGSSRQPQGWEFVPGGRGEEGYEPGYWEGPLRWPLPNVWLGVSVENQAAADERIPILLHTPAAVRFISVEPALGPVSIRNYVRGSREVVECPKCGHVHNSADSFYWTGLERDIEADRCPNCGYDTKGSIRAYIELEDRYILPGLDWVIVGGETGPGARPMHPEWVRSLRDQAVAAGVPFLLKHRGEYLTLPELADLGITLSTAEAMNANTMGGGFYRVGRKRAGRMLDGRAWDEYPEVRA